MEEMGRDGPYFQKACSLKEEAVLAEVLAEEACVCMMIADMSHKPQWLIMVNHSHEEQRGSQPLGIL